MSFPVKPHPNTPTYCDDWDMWEALEDWMDDNAPRIAAYARDLGCDISIRARDVDLQPLLRLRARDYPPDPEYWNEYLDFTLTVAQLLGARLPSGADGSPATGN